jgi:hypothetical protein
LIAKFRGRDLKSLKQDLSKAKIREGMLSAEELQELELEIASREQILQTLMPYNVSELSEATIQLWGEHNYNVNRKGFMKKETTVEKMLVWKAENIKTSLMKLKDSENKDGVAFNKSLLAFTGDRSSNKPEDEHIMKMLSIGKVASDATRDEIYCQLCKQTTENPNIDSRLRTWKLMVLCVANFPPSTTFEPFLTNYFTAHYEQKVAPVIQKKEDDDEEEEEEEDDSDEEAEKAKAEKKAAEEAAAIEAAKQAAEEKAAAERGDEANTDKLDAIEKCAEMCYNKLPKIVQLGGRGELMPYTQSKYVLEMKPVKIRVFLADATQKIVEVDPWSTRADLDIQLATTMEIKNMEAFSVYEADLQENEYRQLVDDERPLDTLASWDRIKATLDEDFDRIAAQKGEKVSEGTRGLAVALVE